MPLYEYDCKGCGKTVEVLVRGSETPECPECASTTLEKRLSVPAVPIVRGGSTGSACDPSLPPCSPTCCRLPK